MQNIIRTMGGLISPINGIEFHQHNDGSVSSPVADEAVVEQFLSVEGYRLATDEDNVPEGLKAVKPTTEKPETAAQKKAREKVEKEAAEAAAKAAAAEAAAAEEKAKALAAEEEAKAKAEAEAKALEDAKLDQSDKGDDSEVF